MSVTSDPIGTGVEVHLLTDEEACEEFDREARLWLGVSGEEFVRRWQAGEYADRRDEFAVRHIAYLLPMVLPAKDDS